MRKKEAERQLKVSNEIREAEKKILINEIEKHTEIKKRLKNLQNGIEEVLTQNLPFHVEKRLRRVLQESIDDDSFHEVELEDLLVQCGKVLDVVRYPYFIEHEDGK